MQCLSNEILLGFHIDYTPDCVSWSVDLTFRINVKFDTVSSPQTVSHSLVWIQISVRKSSDQILFNISCVLFITSGPIDQDCEHVLLFVLDISLFDPQLSRNVAER